MHALLTPRSLRAAAPTSGGHRGLSTAAEHGPSPDRAAEAACAWADPPASRPGTPAPPAAGTHLHVAVVVPGVAAVARVHQHGVQPVHHGLTAALRHVRADVQELGVAHVLGRARKAVRALCLAPSDQHAGVLPCTPPSFYRGAQNAKANMRSRLPSPVQTGLMRAQTKRPLFLKLCPTGS